MNVQGQSGVASVQSDCAGITSASETLKIVSLDSISNKLAVHSFTVDLM